MTRRARPRSDALASRPAVHDAILIFAKAPRPGRVKTRLASQIGPDRACAVYRAMLEATLHAPWVRCAGIAGSVGSVGTDRSRRVPTRVTVLVDPPGARDLIAPLAPAWRDIEFAPQNGSTLGAKLAAGFRDAFAQGARRVVAIGTDSPDLPPSRVRTALHALVRYDATIGPAVDGGYCFIGLARFIPEAFARIPWSTDQVTLRTLAALKAVGARVRVFEPWWDVDTLADVRALIARSPGSQLGRAVDRALGTARALVGSA